jgi:phosphatidylglycerophosphate synthase
MATEARSASSAPAPPAWLPNAISGLRVALVPLFVIVAAQCQAAGRAGADTLPTRLLAVGVLAVIAVSDIVDGWLARRFDLGSPVGAFLDAFADKLCQVALLLFFTSSEGPAFVTVPLWFFAVVFGRDALLGIGLLLVRRVRGTARVVHRWHGKLASLLVFMLLFWIAAGLPQDWGTDAFMVVAVAVAGDALAYSWNGLQQLRGRS